ncbi:MAG: hypothetical protein Q7R96_03800 [Nanoarchaeota archaeon]|nr:hypothetical protein [Nanoarchaeota archaeon]
MAQAEVYAVDFWKKDLMVTNAPLEGPYRFRVAGISLDEAYRNAEGQLLREGMRTDTKDVWDADLWLPDRSKKFRILENGGWHNPVVNALEGKV